MVFPLPDKEGTSRLMKHGGNGNGENAQTDGQKKASTRLAKIILEAM
jgi:hypothetical protein